MSQGELERYPNSSRTLFEPVHCPYTMKWHESPRVPADVLCICADPIPMSPEERRTEGQRGVGEEVRRKRRALGPSMLQNQTIVDAISKAIVTSVRRGGLVVILMPLEEEIPPMFDKRGRGKERGG